MLFNKVRKRIRNIGRLRDILQTFIKHGLGFIIFKLKLHKYLPVSRRVFDTSVKNETIPVQLRLVMEELGPTFIKLGQLLSTRVDTLPADYIDEFKKLQDKVQCFSGDEAVKVIEQELKRKIDEIFEEFTIEPSAGASISQVHEAVLKGGVEVIVKVRRPQIEKIIENDLDILYFLVNQIEKRFPEMLVYQLKDILDEFADKIRRELDFTKEARNIEKFRKNFEGDRTVYIPRVYWEWTTDKVIIIEKIKGIKINELERLKLNKTEVDRIMRNGISALLKQIFVDGFFHADPHPGNIIIMDNNVIGFIDFGMVGFLEKHRKEQLIDLLIAVLQKDAYKIIGVFRRMDILDENIDMDKMSKEISELLFYYYDISLKELRIKDIVEQFTGIIKKYRVKIPREFILLGKTMITIEGIGRELNPDFNIFESLKPFMKEIITTKISLNKILKNISSISSDYFILAKMFPEEASQIIKKVRTGKLRIQFEHVGLSNIIYSLDILINRISVSLIISALLVSSSLIIKEDIGPVFFGIPLISFIELIIAGILGLILIVSILKNREQ